MVASIVLVLICAAAISFYLRFLVAPCRECQFAWILYVVRLQPVAGESAVVEMRREDELSVWAA